MDWWTTVNRCRALENMAYVVATNQGASLKRYPPYSWPGGSQVVDFDGRLLAQASPGPGERIVVAPVDISSLRHERATRQGHQMLAHLRTEAYPVYREAPLSAGNRGRRQTGTLSYERNVTLIEEAEAAHASRAESDTSWRLTPGRAGMSSCLKAGARDGRPNIQAFRPSAPHPRGCSSVVGRARARVWERRGRSARELTMDDVHLGRTAPR
jgi:hypothetical protein